MTSGASGSGNGTVAFSVAANTNSARTGTLTIGGQTFTVTQAGLGCSFSNLALEPNRASRGRQRVDNGHDDDGMRLDGGEQRDLDHRDRRRER